MQVELTLPQRQDLGTLTEPCHPIEIQCEKMWLHHLYQVSEAIQMLMAMVEIVDDADIADAFAAQVGDDRKLIFRFTCPAAMVVDGDPAIDLGCLLCKRSQPQCRFSHPLFLLRRILGGLVRYA